jgi:hypothetical protein
MDVKSCRDASSGKRAGELLLDPKSATKRLNVVHWRSYADRPRPPHLDRMGMTILPRTSLEWRAFQRRSGRIAATALLGSCVLHAGALLMPPSGTLDGVAGARPRPSSSAVIFDAMELVVVSPRQPVAPEQPMRLEIATAEISAVSDSSASALPNPANAATRVGRTTVADPAADGGGAHNSLVWNGFSDLRLAAGIPALHPEEALAEALAQPKGYVSPLRLCYDSVDARADLSREAQDLSRRDRRGWRWGISADGIHLGPITVPVAPPPPPPGAAGWRPERDPCADR